MPNNRSSIESDYVFVDHPAQDELQEDDGFVIVSRDAESHKVVQLSHELEINPTPWLRQAPRKLPNTRFRPRLSPKLYVRPTEGQIRPTLQQDSPVIKEGKEVKDMELPNTRYRPVLSPKSYSLATKGQYRPVIQQSALAMKEGKEVKAMELPNTRFRPGLSPKSCILPTEGQDRPKRQQASPTTKEAKGVKEGSIMEGMRLAQAKLFTLAEEERMMVENFERFMCAKEG